MQGKCIHPSGSRLEENFSLNMRGCFPACFVLPHVATPKPINGFSDEILINELR
jgi:hypothetical protein